MIRAFLAASFVLALAACGSSAAAIGEACSTAGATTDECADGAICTNDATGFTCLKLCTKQDDCAATEACNGISGSDQKSCQPAATK